MCTFSVSKAGPQAQAPLHRQLLLPCFMFYSAFAFIMFANNTEGQEDKVK